MTIYEIIQELNIENGSNYKMDVLRKHADNDLLKRVLLMTYDQCKFTYGITMRNVARGIQANCVDAMALPAALDILENEFATRSVTGNDAMARLEHMRTALNVEDRQVLEAIINRDLRINMGRSNINKVFKNLIVKPVYMRCGTFNGKTSKKFDVKGAFVQLKADGTYREFFNHGESVDCQSRSGEKYDYPQINEHLVPDFFHFGELTVYDASGTLLSRSIGNGMLRKDDFPADHKVVFDVWDMVTADEYAQAARKDKKNPCTTPYHERWARVQAAYPDHTADPMSNPIRAIECREVDNIQDALKWTGEVMKAGLEGTIIKERNGVFKDGTSNQQLKLKLEIGLEVRVTGFLEGTPGTVREKTFGSMKFATDDGTIVGRVSGFTNPQLEEFNSKRDWCIGKVITVTCNDITQARGSETWALSHPRFEEVRLDKTETDTFESAQKAKAAAMYLEEAL